MRFKKGLLIVMATAALLLLTAQLLPVPQVFASDNVSTDLILVPPYPPVTPPAPPSPPPPPDDGWHWPWHYPPTEWDYYHYPYGLRWPPYISHYLIIPPYHYYGAPAYDPPVPVQVPAQIPVPVINSFAASPSYIQSGQGILLSWATANATSVTIAPGIGTVQDSGSYNVNPGSTTTYTLTATSNGGSTSASTTVTVAPYVYSYPTTSAPVATAVVAPEPTTSVLTGGPGGFTDNPGMVITLLGLLAVIVAAGIVLLVRRPALAPAAAGKKTGYTVATQTTDWLPVTTPAAGPRFELSNGKHLSLSGKGILGRSDFSSVLKSDKTDLISRNHLKFICKGEDCFIEDRGSTNGTKLNGSRIDNEGKYLLRDGDKVRLAGVITVTFKS